MSFQYLLIFLLFLITFSLSLKLSESATTTLPPLEDYVTPGDELFENETQNPESECIELEYNFFTRFLFPLDPLNSSIIKSCYELSEKCPPDEDTVSFAKSVGEVPFEKSICPMLEIYIGNMSDCFEKLKTDENRVKLMNCTWKSINFNVINENTPWTGPNDPRPKFKDTAKHYYKTVQSCQSLFQNCTYQLITDKCDSEVVEVLKRHRTTFERAYCTGIEIYDNVDWNMFVLRTLEGVKNQRVISDGVDKDY